MDMDIGHFYILQGIKIVYYVVECQSICRFQYNLLKLITSLFRMIVKAYGKT